MYTSFISFHKGDGPFCHESEWNVGCGNWECFTPRESCPVWPKGLTCPFDAPAIFA